MVTSPSRAHLTIADLCLAIENGEIEALQYVSYYQLKRRDIVRYTCHLVFAPEKRDELAVP